MTDFASMRVWSDEDATSTNPICLDDYVDEKLNKPDLTKSREEKKKSDRKKWRRRRENAMDEESSLADSYISSILGSEDGAEEKAMPQTNYYEKREREKQRRREKLEDLKSRRTVAKKQVQPMRSSLYPSSDEDSNSNENDNNPFNDDDDDLSKNPFSDRTETAVDDDDLSKNPFSDKSESKTMNINPFGNDRAMGMNPFAEETIDEIEVELEETESEEDSEEDVVESSKRLLRCVDQRIQYQKENDEVRYLKSQLKTMKTQAEAMAEQLRRAVETKCDLVLAQNEMERNHEQGLMVKDVELKEMRMYIQEILEHQANQEVNFMNEIAHLAAKLDSNKKKHEEEIENKDSRINLLENKIESLKISAEPNSPTTIRDRYGKEVFAINPSYE